MTGARPRLLIVDDEHAIAPVLERFAGRLGFDVDYRPDGPGALESLHDLRPDVAMVDLGMPRLGGIDVLRAMKAADPACEVILMTGSASIDTAVEGVKAGALDYLSKPFDFGRLGQLLARVRDARQDHVSPFHGMIGRSAGMQDLFASIRRLAPHVRSVLVTGETGTGKELVATALHREGRRRDKKFLTVNCSAVVETLVESELFGHVRGAFTGATETKIGLFEHAHGGTLFLDEAGELPLAVQAKLLRAVEYGEIQRVGALETRRADVCLIAATNRDLGIEAAAGRFRTDLLYRLNVLELHLAPLRERPEDIPPLAAAFVRDCANRLQRPAPGISPAAERLLQQAPWPGNVRELRNVLERACLLSQGDELRERDIVAAMSVPRGGHAPAGAPDAVVKDRNLLSGAQADHIRRVLGATRNNRKAAAQQLGISRRTLYRWLDRLEISQ